VEDEMAAKHETRTEKDSLGEVYVAEGALYGAQTQRAVENFPVSGLSPWRAFIWSMATIKRCAAEVNRDLDLLEPELADVDGDVGGRDILLSGDDSVLVETGDPGVRRDVDTQTDLDAVRDWGAHF
jgi:hypothetical protein